MTKAQLIDVMIFHLNNFSSGALDITGQTLHSEVLTDDGLGSATSKRIYKAIIRWTLLNAGVQDKTWPSKWIELSINQLSDRLLEA